MVNQRISAAAFICVHHLAGALVDQQNMFIFIDHVQKRGSNGQESVFTVGFFKEFVVDVKLQQIAFTQPRVALTPFPVNLNPLQTNVFLQQGGGQQRNGFGQKPVQPLPGIIFPNLQFFQSCHAPFTLVCSVKI